MTTTVISPYDGAMTMIALQRHSCLVHIEYLTYFIRNSYNFTAFPARKSVQIRCSCSLLTANLQWT